MKTLPILLLAAVLVGCDTGPTRAELQQQQQLELATLERLKDKLAEAESGGLVELSLKVQIEDSEKRIQQLDREIIGRD